MQTSAVVVNKLCHFLDRSKVVGGTTLRREVAGGCGEYVCGRGVDLFSVSELTSILELFV